MAQMLRTWDGNPRGHVLPPFPLQDPASPSTTPAPNPAPPTPSSCSREWEAGFNELQEKMERAAIASGGWKQEDPATGHWWDRADGDTGRS